MAPGNQSCPCAARPSMMPAAPVLASTARALLTESISPLAMTGIDTSLTICAMVSYSAAPLKRSARVLPCTVSSCMPDASAIRAILTPLRLAESVPVRIFSVTGTAVAFTTASRIRPTSDSSASSAEPAALRQTFLAGQPILMSMISAPRSD